MKNLVSSRLDRLIVAAMSIGFFLEPDEPCPFTRVGTLNHTQNQCTAHPVLNHRDTLPSLKPRLQATLDGMGIGRTGSYSLVHAHAAHSTHASHPAGWHSGGHS